MDLTRPKNTMKNAMSLSVQGPAVKVDGTTSGPDRNVRSTSSRDIYIDSQHGRRQQTGRCSGGTWRAVFKGRSSTFKCSQVAFPPNEHTLMAILLPVTLGLLCIVISVVLRIGSREASLPPGPPTVPILGNLHLLPANYIHYK